MASIRPGASARLLIVVGSVGHVEAGVGRALKPVRAVVMAVVERVD